MNDSEVFAENVKHYMAFQEWSYAELAAECGTTKQALHKTLNGGRVSLDRALEISMALSVSMDLLLPQQSRRRKKRNKARAKKA